MTQSDDSRILAVLGPTNTGKTHLAIERMLGHDSGMIGFPLRLLARENYDRIVQLRGAQSVALITGEEKIVPRAPQYYCTVEAMPMERRVGFLAVDEIQLCADPERGHVFTDRLLRARGEHETMFLGADTVAPLLRRLVPQAEFARRPRLSTLRYAGARKITRLPSRSAVVTFSANDVYAVAELIRRRRGGAAVVLGALSPRTRNAQVGMFQSGEVDYMVATDAIGMGLNMDLDHVAFASLAKFDGRAPRRLVAAELAQIAGRAGRHMSDGTFGVTADVPALDEETVRRIEEHDFEPLRALMWRSAELDFGSARGLQRSLEARPALAGLTRGRPADDQVALGLLLGDRRVTDLATSPAAVRRLWEVCRVPDFRKVMSDAHARLLGQIYRRLMDDNRGNRLPTDWVAGHVERFDRTDGDIDTLTTRIAHVRTWTYVAHRADWLIDAGHWQGRAREIEDRLSDALHERLTQRFVDRRTAILVRKLKEKAELLGAVSRSGDVLVEGHSVGRLEGFQFHMDQLTGEPEERRALMRAARKALGESLAERVARCAGAGDEAFALQPNARGSTVRISWDGEPIVRLDPGDAVLAPRLTAIASDILEAGQIERLRARCAAWLQTQRSATLGPLDALERAAESETALSGPARGLAFQLVEGLGMVRRAAAAAQIDRLSAADRKALARLGVRIGVELVYVPALLKPDAARLKGLLWRAAEPDRDAVPLVRDVLDGLGARVSFTAADRLPDGFWHACGYHRLGPVALRADMVERLAHRARRRARGGPFEVDAELLSLAGCSREDFAAVLRALGYRPARARPGDAGGDAATGLRFVPKRAAPAKRRRGAPAGDDRKAREARDAGPFAALKSLLDSP